MSLPVHVPMAAAVCALLAFASTASPANLFGSRLVRETRYTKFNVTTTNPSVGTVLDCGIRSVRNKHMLYLQYAFTRKVTEFHGIYSFYKCKEYYVDCEKVVSYNITNGCSKLDVFMYYMQIGKVVNSTYKCPFYGEYSISNFTVNAEEFGAMFSYPMEKWWELYWRMKGKIYDQNNSEFISAIMDLYIIEFRSRHH